jgi:hypothetical protein
MENVTARAREEAMSKFGARAEALRIESDLAQERARATAAQVQASQKDSDLVQERARATAAQTTADQATADRDRLSTSLTGCQRDRDAAQHETEVMRKRVMTVETEAGAAVVAYLPKCPCCRAPTEKYGGCDHVHCTRCQTDWIYSTGLRKA